VSRIVAFMIKNIHIIILFASLVGWPDSSPIEIKRKLRHNIKKKLLRLMLGLASLLESAHVCIIVLALTRATILGTPCMIPFQGDEIRTHER